MNKKIIAVSMISSIKYISPALLFNKSFLKSYQYLVSLLYLIQSLWLYLDLISNKFIISLVSICWFYNDLLIIDTGMKSKSCSVIMLFIIGVISTYIIIYSFNYMIGDSHYTQFYLILQCFTFSMNLLVMSNNMIIVFFSWELVGLCSYYLIIFWKCNQSSHVSSIKAIL